MSMRPPPNPPPDPVKGAIGCVFCTLILLVAAGLGVSELVGWIRGPKATRSPASAQSSSTDFAPSRFLRPALGPNGRKWPTTPSYIAGMDHRNTSGLSSVTVDNSRCSNDVLVKLYSLDSSPPAAVRVFFIPAGARFTAENLNAGDYDVRYQALDDGSLARSEDFSLTERETYNGTEYSTIEMTLYKVTHGNMQTYPLSPADF